mgnify:CR=1 FL=1
MSFIRYPGGKSKLRAEILKQLDKQIYLGGSKIIEYREPFFGGGSIGLKFLEMNPYIHKAWINDKDVGVASLWTSVMRYHDELKRKVVNFVPSVDIFYQYKDILLSNQPMDVVELGFMKLAVHQMSFSGLGVMAGGPIGGKTQLGNYTIDCRWSADYICNKINKYHALFSRTNMYNNICSSFNFEKVLEDDIDDNALVYIDPPYYVKGNDLYIVKFEKSDHMRLAELLKCAKYRWLLSYDDCEEVRELYNWAVIQPVGVNYTIKTSRNKSEVLIFRE